MFLYLNSRGNRKGTVVVLIQAPFPKSMSQIFCSHEDKHAGLIAGATKDIIHFYFFVDDYDLFV